MQPAPNPARTGLSAPIVCWPRWSTGCSSRCR